MQIKSTLKFCEDEVALNGKPFRREEWPQAIDILDTMDQKKGAVFVVKGSIQSWKTLVGQLKILSSPVLDPSDTAFYTRSGEGVDEFIDEKFGPLFESTKAVSDLIDPGANHKKRKIFPHMKLFFFSAGVQLSRNSKTLQTVLLDEPWTYDPGWIKEIHGRQTSFEPSENWRLILMTSGPDKGSETHEYWKKTDCRIWNGVCPEKFGGCGGRHLFEFFPPEPVELKHRADDRGRPVNVEGKEMWQPWGGLFFDLGEAVRVDDELDQERFRSTVELECPCCGKRWRYSRGHLAAMNDIEAGAGYQPSNPAPARNYFGWEFNALCHTNWELRALDFVEAMRAKRKGDTSLLEDFYRKRLAREWDLKILVKDSKNKTNVAEYLMKESWEKANYQFMSIDTQQDHYYAGIRQWASDAESRLRCIERIDSASQLREMQKDYGIPDHEGNAGIDQRTNRIRLGQPCYVGIDGNHFTSRVRQLAAQYNWMVLRGRDSDDFPHVDGRRRIFSEFDHVDPWAGTVNASQNNWVLEVKFSNKRAMEILQNLRERDEPRLWFYPEDAPTWYVDGINSWARMLKQRPKDQSYYYEWQQLDAYDHPFDIEKMQIVIAAMAGVVGKESGISMNETSSEKAA